MVSAILPAVSIAAVLLGHVASRSNRKMPTVSSDRMQVLPFPETRCLSRMPYGDRQFIAYASDSRVVPAGGQQCDGPVALGLSWSAMQSQGIKFPPGHPRQDVLYVSHPCTGTLYYPASDFHRAVFEHKFAELLTLLASLGATRIDVEARYGWGRDFSANLTLPLPNLAGTVDGHGSARKNRKGKLVFSTTGPGRRSKPKIPSDLVWLESEPIWKAMANAERTRWRTEPSEVAWKLQYKDTFGVDAKLQARLDGLSVGLGGKFTQYEKTLWDVTAEFSERRRSRFWSR